VSALSLTRYGPNYDSTCEVAICRRTVDLSSSAAPAYGEGDLG